MMYRRIDQERGKRGKNTIDTLQCAEVMTELPVDHAAERSPIQGWAERCTENNKRKIIGIFLALGQILLQTTAH